MVFAIKILNVVTLSIHEKKNSKCAHFMFDRVSKPSIYFLAKNWFFFIFKGSVKTYLHSSAQQWEKSCFSEDNLLWKRKRGKELELE